MMPIAARYKERIKASGYTSKEIFRSRMRVLSLILAVSLLFCGIAALLSRQFCLKIQDQFLEGHLEILKGRLEERYTGNMEEAMNTAGVVFPYIVANDANEVVYYCGEDDHISKVTSLAEYGLDESALTEQRHITDVDGESFYTYFTDATAKNGEHFKILSATTMYGFIDVSQCLGSFIAFLCMALFTACYALFFRAEELRGGKLERKADGNHRREKIYLKYGTFILVGSLIAILFADFLSDFVSTSQMKELNDLYYEPVLVRSLNEKYRANEERRKKEELRMVRVAASIAEELDESKVDGEEIQYRVIQNDVTVTVPNASGNPTTCRRNSEYLGELAAKAGIEEIRIFDSNGYLIATSDSIWKWFLNTDGSAEDYEFRRVLDREVDSFAGEYEYSGERYLAAGIPIALQTGEYGVLVAEENLEGVFRDNASLLKDLMSELETDLGSRYALIRADEEKTVEYVSPEFGTDSLEGLKLVDDAFEGRFVDISYVNETRYFIQCDKRNDVAYFGKDGCYIASYAASDFVNMLGGTPFFPICFVIQVILLIVVIVFAYRFKNDTVLAFDYKNETMEDEKRGIISLTPGQKLVKVMGRTFSVIITVFLLFVIYNLVFEPNSLYYHLMNYDWNSGFNILTIVCIIVTGFLVVVLTWGLKKLGKKIETVVSPKTLTVIRIAISVLTFVLVILYAFYIMYMLGMDVSKVWTSLGIFSLVLGLGAQSLIKDILAGFFIMVENKFKIGDKVAVDGFEGQVTEVGLRSCTITSSNGVVKVINNSALDNVTNFSQKLNLIKIVIPIRIDYPYEKLQKILEEGIVKIKRENEPIIHEIKLLGVTAVCPGAANPYYEIGVASKCDANESSSVELRIKDGLLKLGEEYGFLMVFANTKNIDGEPKKEN